MIKEKQARIEPHEETSLPLHQSLGHHHLHELFVVDVPITVHIRVAYHLSNLHGNSALGKDGSTMQFNAHAIGTQQRDDSLTTESTCMRS